MAQDVPICHLPPVLFSGRPARESRSGFRGRISCSSSRTWGSKYMGLCALKTLATTRSSSKKSSFLAPTSSLSARSLKIRHSISSDAYLRPTAIACTSSLLPLEGLSSVEKTRSESFLLADRVLPAVQIKSNPGCAYASRDDEPSLESLNST